MSALGATELLDAVYRVTDPAHLGDLAEVGSLTREQVRELGATLATRREALSDAERAGLEQGDHRVAGEVLRRIVARRMLADQSFARDRLQQRAAGYGRLVVGAPLQDSKALDAARRELSTLITAAAPQRAARGTKILGTTRAAFDFAGGFPAGGRSGEAAAHPVFVFLPERLRSAAQGAGIHTLADFLVAGMGPASRGLSAQVLGIPSTTMLLATHRAELLDLPVGPRRERPPHLKDALLLARLGAGNVHALTTLGRLFDRSPSRLDLLAELIARLQRARPETVGRGRLTKHDLRGWALAAERRGSEVRLTEGSPAGASEVEAAAERVLAWLLETQWHDPESAFDDVLVRLLLWMRSAGVALDDDARRRMVGELGTPRAHGLLELSDRPVNEADVARAEEEARRYERFRLADLAAAEGASIFTDLAPSLAPDSKRKDRLICFFLDPVPDDRHAVGTGAGPQSLAARYVCLDPDSGAVVPFA